MKIAFLSIKKKGIGSLGIQIEIAKGLRKLNPEWEFLFITDLDFTDWFYRCDLRFVRIPCEKENVNDATEIIKETIKAYSPGIMFFNDKYSDELTASNIENSIANYLVLDEYSPLKQHNGFEKVFYLSHAKIEGFESVGYIARESESAQIEKKYKTEGKFNILITLGAGNSNYAENIAELSVNACLNLKSKNKRLNIIFIPGPLFKNYEHLQHKDIIMQRYEPNLISLMEKTDLIISNSGLGTITEIQMLKKKAIIFSHGTEKDILREKGMYVIDDFSEENITSAIAKAIKEYEFPPQIGIEINTDEAIMLINHGLNQKELFQEINLDKKTLTSVLSELEINNKRILLNFSNFSWYDLLLVLEFLTKKNVKEFYIKIHENQIPKDIIDKLKRHPCAYIIVISTKKDQKDKIKAINALIKEHLPVICLCEDNSLAEECKSMQVNWSKSLTRKEFLVNLLEKEISIFSNQLFKIEKEKGSLLLKHGLETKMHLLDSMRKAILSKDNVKFRDAFSINKKISKLECEKENLLEGKKIKDEFYYLIDEAKKTRSKIEAAYSLGLKNLEQKKLSLQHQLFNIFEKHSLTQIKKDKEEKVKQMKEEIENKWNAVIKKIEIEKRKNEIMSQSKDIGKYPRKKIEVEQLKKAQKEFWEKLNILERKKAKAVEYFSNLDYPETKEINALEMRKKQIIPNYNQALNDKFAPLRIALAVAEARNAPTEEILELQVQKEYLWKELLAPIEKEIDMINARILILQNHENVAGIIKEHSQKIKELESEIESIIRSADEISLEIDKKIFEINDLKKIPAVKKYSEIEEHIEKLEKSKEIVAAEVKNIESDIAKIENEYNEELSKKRIQDEISKCQKRIDKIQKKIEEKNAELKEIQEYSYYLEQKKSNLLDENGVLEKINKIDYEIGILYLKINDEKQIRKLKETTAKTIQLLSQKKIYNKWNSMEKQELMLRNKIDFLKNYI